jgi:hypothetical protein
MPATEQTQKPRMLTGDELAVLVKLYREFRQWSQEQLAKEVTGGKGWDSTNNRPSTVPTSR